MDILKQMDCIINEKSDYDKFFEKKLKEWDIKSPSELSKKEKIKFFNEIDDEWKSKKEKSGEDLDEKIEDHLDESIIEWLGFDKIKNKILIQQEGSNSFYATIDDKKGNNIKTAILDTLDKAMDFVKNFANGTIKWMKNKDKKSTGNIFKSKRKIRNILLGR